MAVEEMGECVFLEISSLHPLLHPFSSERLSAFDVVGSLSKALKRALFNFFFHITYFL
jgi:hypothetical protein